MPCSQNSKVGLSDVTIHVVFHNTTTPGVTDDADTTVTYSRVNPSAAKRKCHPLGSPIPYDPLSLLSPGEYLIDSLSGSDSSPSCCPCFGVLIPKQAPDQLGGTRVFSDGSPTEDIYVRASFFIDLLGCSTNRLRLADHQPSGPSVAVTITIADVTTGPNGEQTVLFSGPTGDFTGAAQLSWQPPTGAPVLINIDMSPAPSSQPNIGFLINQLLALNASLGPDVVVSNEGTGVRFGFVKKYGKQTVNPITIVTNTLFSAPLETLEVHFGARFDLLIDGVLTGDDGTTDTSYNTPCKDSFESIGTLTDGGLSWTITLEA